MLCCCHVLLEAVEAPLDKDGGYQVINTTETISSREMRRFSGSSRLAARSPSASRGFLPLSLLLGGVEKDSFMQPPQGILSTRIPPLPVLLNVVHLTNRNGALKWRESALKWHASALKWRENGVNQR